MNNFFSIYVHSFSSQDDLRLIDFYVWEGVSLRDGFIFIIGGDGALSE